MKSPKIPKPPDPAVTAAAQTGSNQSTAMYQSLLNMQDQVTPYGNVTWGSSGEWSYTDPTTGKVVKVPKFTGTTTLTPEQQALLKQEQQFDARFNDIALRQTDRVKDTLADPFKYDVGAHEAWSSDLYDKLNNDDIASARQTMEQGLANRGLQIGTKAYDDAVRNFEYSQQKARNDFKLGSYSTGMNTALTERNQPLAEAQALMGAGQIQQPSWVTGPQTGVAGTDTAGITMAAYNANAARAAQQGGVINALGNLGGMALGGWLSDERAKDVGPTKGYDKQSGLPVHDWEYEGGEGEGEGPTAQEVERTYPEAVSEGPDGLLRVDWRMVPGGERFMPERSQKGTHGYKRPYVGKGMRELPDTEVWPRGKGNGSYGFGPAPGLPYSPWPDDMPKRKEMQAGKRNPLMELGRRIAA
jgi:hypothetical protein